MYRLEICSYLIETRSYNQVQPFKNINVFNKITSVSIIATPAYSFLNAKLPFALGQHLNPRLLVLDN